MPDREALLLELQQRLVSLEHEMAHSRNLIDRLRDHASHRREHATKAPAPNDRRGASAPEADGDR